METIDLPDKEFKVTVVMMFTKLGRRMDEHSENISKEMENIRKYQTKLTELKSTKTKDKYTIEGFNSRLDEAEEVQDQMASLVNSIKHSKEI